MSCSNVSVDHNLVTGYSNIHDASATVTGFTDGISGTCEGASYTNNDIIDPSDVGIVIFTPGTGYIQTSKASGNVIISAGVPSYGAMVMDAMSKASGVSGDTSFAGASFNNNHFWAAPDSHFDMGIAVGSRPWGDDNDGIGGSVTSNSTDGIATPMRIAIDLEGMKQATIQGNSYIRAAPLNYNFNCPEGDFLADLSPTNNHGYGSNIQSPVQNATSQSCIAGHSPAR